MYLENILNDCLNKVLCQKERIQNPNSNNIAEFVTKYLILIDVKPRFSVSLVYQDQNNNVLRTLILDAKSKHEALGKTIEYFEKETKGLALILKTVTQLNK